MPDCGWAPFPRAIARAHSLASQLVLPLGSQTALGRADFIVAECNAQAMAFIDSWPDWPVNVAALYGPAGSGKTHLASIWKTCANAQIISAPGKFDRTHPTIIEDVDSIPATSARDAALFALIEGASREAPVLLTGREAPPGWATTMPDLASRFSAMLSFPLWAPDDGLLAGLARKLFTDRQLAVPEPVIQRMILSLERSPAAVREFVAEADAKALSEARPVNLGLVREMLAARETG